MKKFRACIIVFIALSMNINASPVEDLILLCRGGMDTKQILQVSGEIEGKLLKFLKPNVEVTSSLRSEGSISQYDLIKSIKSGVSESLYKHDLKEYHLCIERMAPLTLTGRAEISGKMITILKTSRNGLIKTPIYITEKDSSYMVFQYASLIDGEYVIAIRLVNNSNNKRKDFYLNEKTALLVGEDSGEEYELKTIIGLGSSNRKKIFVPPKGSKLVKFAFRAPTSLEPMTFSSAWSQAGDASNMAIAITFNPKPLNITWLNVGAIHYKYEGLPDLQKK